MRKTRFAFDEYYHIYNRGVDRRVIFSSQEDYDRFEAYLYLLNDSESLRAANYFSGSRHENIYSHKRMQPLVAIGAYCLMQNHFHLLLTPLVENGISRFMQKVQTGYTMYFNEKYQRSGSLFEGTFKSVHAKNDVQLKYLYAYIHMNPAILFDDSWEQSDAHSLESLAKKTLLYRYSSAGEYGSASYVITDPTHFPRYFKTRNDAASQVRYWLAYKSTRSRINSRKGD